MPQVLDDPTLRDNRARLADLRRQLSDLSVTLTPANYKIQQLKAQIADLEAAVCPPARQHYQAARGAELGYRAAQAAVDPGL